MQRTGGSAIDTQSRRIVLASLVAVGLTSLPSLGKEPKCPAGQGFNVFATSGGGSGCIPCEANEVTKNNECAKCPAGLVPAKDRVNCVPRQDPKCSPGQGFNVFATSGGGSGCIPCEANEVTKNNECAKCPAGLVPATDRQRCQARSDNRDAAKKKTAGSSLQKRDSNKRESPLKPAPAKPAKNKQQAQPHGPQQASRAGARSTSSRSGSATGTDNGRSGGRSKGKQSSPKGGDHGRVEPGKAAGGGSQGSGSLRPSCPRDRRAPSVARGQAHQQGRPGGRGVRSA
jgi:hypothetical protein